MTGSTETSDTPTRTIPDGTDALEHTKSEPLVTVVITTYNRPSYLENAVRSVRSQTYGPIELVVVDDHSETPASRTLADVPDDRFVDVTSIRHDRNRGANAARNTGIEAASGEYVAFLDDDDTWVPTKLARQVAAFQRHDEIGVVYTGVLTKRDGGTDVGIPPQVEGNITKALLCQNVVGTLSSVMVRADLAREVPFDEQFPSWADLEWYVNLSTRATFHRIPEPLVVYEYESHNRLSDDFEKKRVAYERFLVEFDGLAARFGPLFHRKMRAWAAYRLGSTALNMRRYSQSRRLLATAIRWYPFEPRFTKYFLATLGGRYTHGIVREVKHLFSTLNSRI